MKKLLSGARQNIGQSPGELVYTGKNEEKHVTLHLWEYDDAGVLETIFEGDFKKLKSQKHKKKWLHFNGIHDLEALKTLGEQFKIHPLFLEDVLNVNQRPKIERIDDCYFVSMKLLDFNEEQELISHVVSFVVLEDSLFSFSESDKDDWFLPVVKRLNDPKRTLRQRSTSYLLYALMDVLVDHYLGVLEHLGEAIEDIDSDILLHLDSTHLDRLYNLKKQLLLVRKQTSPVSELIHKMPNEISAEHWEAVKIYFDDLLDHTVQVQETTRTYLDALTNLFDLYFSLTNEKMNRTIQMLTVITVVFLPLTLLTGMYGMNFQFMPRISDPNAFWEVIVFMILLSVTILSYLKHKKWF